MLTDQISEQWDNDSLIDFMVAAQCASLCVPVGDFSRQLTSMWRRAALHEWWPMRIYQSFLYQVSCISFILLEDNYNKLRLENSNLPKPGSMHLSLLYTGLMFYCVHCPLFK